MSRTLLQNQLIVKKSKTHGFGVFAGKDFRKGAKLEECYMLLSKRGGDKGLEDYYFDAKGKWAIFTGFGCIYNHAEDPNAIYCINMKTKIVTIYADKAIKKGEEIFVSYGDGWFKDRGVTPK